MNLKAVVFIYIWILTILAHCKKMKVTKSCLLTFRMETFIIETLKFQ